MTDFRCLEVCLNDGQIPDKPLGLDISDTRTDHPDTADQSWRREVNGSTNQAAVAPKVVRKITARGLAKAHEEPYPGEQVTSLMRPKLSERGTTDVHRPERPAWELRNNPGKPPGFNSCDTILSKKLTQGPW